MTTHLSQRVVLNRQTHPPSVSTPLVERYLTAVVNFQLSLQKYL